MNAHNNFISLEGIDNVGKTTAADQIKKYLEGLGRHVVVAHDPPRVEPWSLWKDTIQGKNLISTPARAALYLAARLDSVNRIIKPALENNSFVVADRYTDSWFAYQITSFEKFMHKDKAYKLLYGIHKSFVSAGLIIEPRRTFLIIGDPKVLAERGKNKSPSVYDEIEKQEKTQGNYLWLSKKSKSGRIRIIDSKNRAQDEIVKEICEDSVIASSKK